MKVKTLVLSRHTFRNLTRVLLLILWFSSLMVKAQIFSEERFNIYVSDGAFIYSAELSENAGLKQASVSDKHKESSSHFRKKKVKEQACHFRKGNSKTLAYSYRSNHPKRHTWGISGSNRWMGILCHNKISGYGILVAPFFYDLLLLLAMMLFLWSFYNSLSLNKICIFFCCRPPPGKYIV
ncbi:hypothetical protein SAMN05421846_11079 [Chryseobacterium taeanense]|uniref:Uncharacterized protein n=1 Tax=Chryseobacterium taeanense TaxID=311334 RepID=A0A1G8LWI8_9FLAO|nr:hypothetical protein [Chryseobacterium taeanense]SDI59847.1 hypothetical protein SAMN05421846_11079 [Chryseobacterium taeanense]